MNEGNVMLPRKKFTRLFNIAINFSAAALFLLLAPVQALPGPAAYLSEHFPYSHVWTEQEIYRGWTYDDFMASSAGSTGSKLEICSSGIILERRDILLERRSLPLPGRSGGGLLHRCLPGKFPGG